MLLSSVLTVEIGTQGADESHILPRDSLAEIMAAEEVVAAKQQLHAAQLAQRANSFESSATNPPHAGARPACVCGSQQNQTPCMSFHNPVSGTTSPLGAA